MTGQDRGIDTHRCWQPWCSLQPHRDPQPTPRKETEAEKRLGKNRLLIRLHHGHYRAFLTC